MSTETPDRLWHLWNLQELPLERAVGQMLQHIVNLDDKERGAAITRVQLKQALDSLEKSLRDLRADVDALMTHTNMESPNKRKRKKQGEPKSAPE